MYLFPWRSALLMSLILRLSFDINYGSHTHALYVIKTIMVSNTVI